MSSPHVSPSLSVMVLTCRRVVLEDGLVLGGKLDIGPVLGEVQVHPTEVRAVHVGAYERDAARQRRRGQMGRGPGGELLTTPRDPPTEATSPLAC